jgi:solute carrier family 35 protein F5
MAVVGAAGYGMYTTMLRLKVSEDGSASMQLLLGYLGLVSAIILSPMLILMASLDLGNVRQLTWTAFGFVLLSGFFDNVIADYLWARSVLLTSPTVATVGLTLTIPMAIFIDSITKVYIYLYILLISFCYSLNTA